MQKCYFFEAENLDNSKKVVSLQKISIKVVWAPDSRDNIVLSLR